MADAAHAEGVKFAIDVRANVSNPLEGRPQSGHDYKRLLKKADRLVVWAYIGLTGQDGAKALNVKELSSTLVGAFGPERIEISIGMWNDANGLAPNDLQNALTAAESGGARRVSVTPASMLSSAHYASIQTAWK